MSFEWFVARRYLRSPHRPAILRLITLFSVIGVAAGVATLVIALAMNSGFRETLQDRLLGVTAHISLTRPGSGGISNYQALSEKLRQMAGVRSVTPAIYETVLLSFGGQARGVVTKGIDVERSHTDTENMECSRKNRSNSYRFIFAGVSLAYCADDPRVETIVLDSKGVTQIPVCAGYVTTVLFPRPVSGIVGYGLTNDPAAEEGWIQYAHPGDSGLVTLRVLKPELRVAYMTVLVGDDLYNFALANNPGQAALSVKLTDGERQVEPPIGSTPGNAANAQTTPALQRAADKEDIVNARPVYHPESYGLCWSWRRKRPFTGRLS